MPIQLGRLQNDQMLPLLGGAYQAKSVIANAQRCVNLYPEFNQIEQASNRFSSFPTDADTPVTHYQAPGLVELSPCPIPGKARGRYWATTGQLFAVVGANVYQIAVGTWVWTLLGQIAAGTTPVSMVDNGTTLLIVDGTASGYEVTLASGVFAVIADPNFFGANTIGFLSTFLVSNLPGTQEFQSTLSGQPPTWDALYVASKTGFADPLRALAVVHLEIWLLGTLTTEIWFLSGGSTFPFAIYPGVFIQHGLAATFGFAVHDLTVFYISQDKDGRAIALAGTNYQVQRISTHAIEVAWQSYQTVSDCICDVYQIEGHVFIRFHFPSADKTWVFDDRTQLWHEIESIDGDGVAHGSLDRFAGNAGSIVTSLDWATGALYELDPDTYTDNGVARVYRRGFPTVIGNGKQVRFASFKADMECGTADITDPTPTIFLRWSDTRGKSYGNAVGQSMGATGEYAAEPQWNRLGRGRFRVFELFWSTNAKAALNGAWVDALGVGQ